MCCGLIAVSFLSFIMPCIIFQRLSTTFAVVQLLLCRTSLRFHGGFWYTVLLNVKPASSQPGGGFKDTPQWTCRTKLYQTWPTRRKDNVHDLRDSERCFDRPGYRSSFHIQAALAFHHGKKSSLLGLCKGGGRGSDASGIPGGKQCAMGDERRSHWDFP